MTNAESQQDPLLSNQEILGKEAIPHLVSLNFLAPTLTGLHYNFISIDEYRRTLEEDTRKGNRVYWDEMLQRTHLAASCAIIRQKRWLDGLIQCAKVGNYLSFAASYRGLLESVADSHYTLSGVAPTLATNFSAIRLALSGQLDEIQGNEELENRLIHFTHARKIKKGESASDEHRAKTSKEYLLHLQAGIKADALKCYERLCETVHPAVHSLSWMIRIRKDGGAMLIDTSGDIHHIRGFCEEHHDLMRDLLVIGFNQPAITLKVLNKFEQRGSYTPAMDSISFETIKAWRDLSERIEEQLR